MSWELHVPKSANKSITCFPKKEGLRIFTALQELAVDPYVGDIEKIRGEKNTWRRRIGNYRITYDIDIKNKTISIVLIRRRTSTTYKN